MQSRELPCGRGVPTSITMALAGGLAALNAVAHRSLPIPRAAGLPDGERRWPDLHRDLDAFGRPRGGPHRGRRRPAEPARVRWIAFRRWVAGFEGGRFRLLGTSEHSWDWPHVELADAPLGFRSVEALLQAARR